jgi:hypothetical protein
MYITGGGSRVVALFLPLGGEATTTVVGKIPHYGTFSCLASVSDHNPAKGLWRSTSSTTTHHFTLKEVLP